MPPEEAAIVPEIVFGISLITALLTALLVAVNFFALSKKPVLITVTITVFELNWTLLRVNLPLASVVAVAAPPVMVALLTGELLKSVITP